MEMSVFMQKLQIRQKTCYIEQNGSGGPIILWGMYPHRGNEIAHMWDCLMETVNDQDFLFCLILFIQTFHTGKQILFSFVIRYYDCYFTHNFSVSSLSGNSPIFLRKDSDYTLDLHFSICQSNGCAYILSLPEICALFLSYLQLLWS